MIQQTLVAGLVAGLMMTGQEAIDSPMNPFFDNRLGPDTSRIQYTQEDVRCLAQNIYFEARNEPIQGRLAVAFVTVNRVRDASFPNTVCAVVRQGIRRGRHHLCQFSWYCDRRADIVRNEEKYADAMTLAMEVLEGHVEDNTNGALYYHANYVSPRWRDGFEHTTTIGNHIFYRP